MPLKQLHGLLNQRTFLPHFYRSADRRASKACCFDVAVPTLVMHQFEPETAVKELEEMRRLAKRIIIADYNCPMTQGPAAWLAWGIERAARSDHYRNFRKYMARGRLSRLAEEEGLAIVSREKRGEGVFTLTQMLLREDFHRFPQ